MEFNYSKAFFVMLQGKTYKNTIWHHLLLIRNLSYLTIYYQELAHLVFKPHNKRERDTLLVTLVEKVRLNRSRGFCSSFLTSSKRYYAGAETSFVRRHNTFAEPRR